MVVSNRLRDELFQLGQERRLDRVVAVLDLGRAGQQRFDGMDHDERLRQAASDHIRPAQCTPRILREINAADNRTGHWRLVSHVSRKPQAASRKP